MKSIDIIKLLEDMLKTGKLQHDLNELGQLRKQANNLLGIQVVYHDGKYTVRLRINEHKFETRFTALPDRTKHKEAVRTALQTVISNAVTHYILDDAEVSMLFSQHFK